MSDSISTNTTPISAFQAHFGTRPGALDTQTECKQWEHLCAELLAERARLQAELARAQTENEANVKSLLAMICKDFKLDLTMQEVYAQVDKETPLDQFIAEFERNDHDE